MKTLKVVYIVECEWDIDQSQKVFKTRGCAQEWVQNVWPSDIGNVKEAFEDGLVSIEELIVQDY